ncbi:hypothetical protein HGB07_03775 [Candidatus Roizmanbacteria bacterium]|nr:hypothetical protein [Candidatus Roizmanbacteria bacterium]
MTPEKTIVSQLEKSYSHALDIYKARGLHMRTRNVADIENKDEKIHETLRHNLIRYELIEMNRNVRRLIRKSAKSNSLLKLYDEIDLRRENWTNASAIGLNG